MQKILNPEQIEAFYHDQFVQQQVEHFKKIALSSFENNRVVVDVGGGGYFASAIAKELGVPVRVIDRDPVSVDVAKLLGVDAVVGDALHLDKKDDEGTVCFNLILHHLVADTEAATKQLQSNAIAAWKGDGVKVFVNEYIYESWFSGFSGWLIYQITKNKILSLLGQAVSRFVPSLRANTFGVGVRFRSRSEWHWLFENTGFRLVGEVQGKKEFISLPRRLLLIKEIRRDSFLLASA
jgi:hypothetical protein